MTILRTNDIITAEKLASIIRTHGAGHISIDGSIPEPYADATKLELDGTERFQVVVNYGHAVRFHLITQDVSGSDTIDGDYRAYVTTGLTGRCDDVQGWIAETSESPRTLSISEFESLVARDDWQRTQSHEEVERMVREVEQFDDETEEFDLVSIPHVWGFASRVSTLDGITIDYTEGYNYDECQPDSLTTGTEGQDVIWTIEGAVVVGEDGDELSVSDLADYLPGAFQAIDYDSLLTIEQITDIDTDEDSDMDTITLNIDNAPSIRFTGERIGHAESTDNNAAGSSYSGQTGRWTELALYKTVGGKYVCHQIGRTRWQGERDRFSGKVCETLDEVKAFFGHRWLAKELYDDAGIEDVTEVE